ncbi:hypothetical protein M409DRAFT_24243 [Zasmidium cellare ATCC 36951]|uniref:NAD(P)-binding protein n=1 Tax=Zasmidium cellare ATCC 36951 TaxID=1080233 RepID=A0A6A6CFH0_ZASCE|nr:uncharacterized protein M409DRAFT_24243 [Zasmidium cellare ATCC 36951]KAF2165393.1 hypothetical protein M409DRAFT_24243 [Zasmidium cellare ATCC 36951]
MPSYLITGAGRGLGYAFLKQLAADPNNTVIGMVRNKDAGTQKLKSDAVENVHLVEGDITSVRGLSLAMKEVASITHGSLDVLINNAAYVSDKTRAKTLLDGSDEELQEDLMHSSHVNVVGVAHTIRAFLPLLRKGNVKNVITISTGVADLDMIREAGIAVAGPYGISKAATNALVAKFHAALGKQEGILFLVISPGFVDTSEENSTPEKVKG